MKHRPWTMSAATITRAEEISTKARDAVRLLNSLGLDAERTMAMQQATEDLLDEIILWQNATWTAQAEAGILHAEASRKPEPERVEPDCQRHRETISFLERELNAAKGRADRAEAARAVLYGFLGRVRKVIADWRSAAWAEQGKAELIGKLETEVRATSARHARVWRGA